MKAMWNDEEFIVSGVAQRLTNGQYDGDPIPIEDLENDYALEIYANAYTRPPYTYYAKGKDLDTHSTRQKVYGWSDPLFLVTAERVHDHVVLRQLDDGKVELRCPECGSDRISAQSLEFAFYKVRLSTWMSEDQPRYDLEYDDHEGGDESISIGLFCRECSHDFTEEESRIVTDLLGASEYPVTPIKAIQEFARMFYGLEVQEVSNE